MLITIIHINCYYFTKKKAMDFKVGQLTSLQLELLKVYAFSPTEAELLEVKQMLGKFFAYRFANKVNEAIASKNITDKDFEAWLNES